MKIVILILVIICAYAITCPNMCSGHGSCNNGVCLCSFGFTGGDCSLRLCPRDVPYTDPNGELAVNARTFLECSGQGKCNRVSGLCECFSGYEGTACQRQKCPNNCNNHGICTPVNLLRLEDRVIEDAYYDNGYWEYSTKWQAKTYEYWDKDHSFSCVCDKEWFGYDCSLRKCPTGYVSVSDCDSEPQTTQTITFTTALTTSNTFYIEYTDQLGRKWYTDLVSGNTDASTTADNIKTALQKLPPGVIDLADVAADTVTANLNKVFTIKFGKHQTGKQTPMRVIGTTALSTGGEFGVHTAPPGYHGMHSGTDGATLTGDPIVATVDGIAPLVCGGNGVCQTDTGLCDCFDDYYGNACTLQRELI